MFQNEPGRWYVTDSETIEILLVEDNPADAELTLHALRKGKLASHVELVRDGEEALDFLFCRGNFSHRRSDTALRLVLLDLKLPKVDGLKVLDIIKHDPRTRVVPVIVLTSSKEERDLLDSYRSGVNSYIQKPVNFSEFQEVVRQLGMYWLLTNHAPPESAFAAKTESPTK
jgi:two-component system, response regulator